MRFAVCIIVFFISSAAFAQATSEIVIPYSSTRTTNFHLSLDYSYPVSGAEISLNKALPELNAMNANIISTFQPVFIPPVQQGFFCNFEDHINRSRKLLLDFSLR